jgi:hypothetical protein
MPIPNISITIGQLTDKNDFDSSKAITINPIKQIGV